MRAVLVLLFACCFVLGCEEKKQAGFELNARRIAELAGAVCSCSDSISNTSCAESYNDILQAKLVAQVEAGRVKLDSARWGDCIAQLRACDTTPRACDGVFAGALQEGDACDAAAAAIAFGEECADGLRCEADDPDDDDVCALKGSCVEIEMYEHGEACELLGACEDEDDICGVDTSGDEEGDICRSPIEKGDPCPVEEFGLAGSLLCATGLGCVPNDDAEIVCGKPLAQGTVCTYMVGDFAGVAPCVAGTYCNPTTTTCDAYDFPPGAELGEDCEVRADCLPGLTCLDDECARPLPNGSACDGEDQCVAYCVDEACVPGFEACDLQ